MKRMSLLLAGTAIPLALLLTPNVSAREALQPRVLVAQATPDVIILAQAGNLADDAAQAAAAATEAEARAAALAAEAAAAQAAAAAADAADDAEEKAVALAEQAEAAAREAAELRARADAVAAESAAQAEAEAAAEREAAAAAEVEAEAERAAAEAEAAAEAQAAAERQATEAEAEAEAEAQAQAQARVEREAAAEAEAEARRVAAEAEAAAEAERQAEAARQAEAEREAEATAAAEAEAEAEAEVEAEAAADVEPTPEAAPEPAREERPARERTPETQAAPALAPAPAEAPAAVAEPTPAPTEAAPVAEPRATEVAPDGERRERRERRRDDPAAATTTEAPALQLQAEEPQRFEDVREGRRERVEEGVTIIEEPGARTILQEGDRLIIRQGEEERARRTYRDVRRERRGEQEVLIAPRDGGVEIITILDTDGNLLRRIRREADGRETVLIDNTRDLTTERRWDWRDGRRSERREERREDRRQERRDDRRVDDRQGDRLIGRVGSVFEFRIDVPPPVVSIPRERYIVDYGTVYEEDYLEEVFLAPPVAEVRDRYTLDEVRYNPNLRDYMPRVDLDAVTFASGSWQLSRAQVDELSEVADAMNSVIAANPDEIFLIEGHTDAIGRAIDNLSLSDRRAETVAYILSEYYDVPPENLVTQGYGEEFLKIDTQAAERRNRRVTIRRITPLMAQAPRG